MYDRPSVKLFPQTMHSFFIRNQFIRKRGYNIHLSQKLQGRALDIVMAYQEINTVIEDMTEIRNNIETVYKRIYNQAVRIAEKMDVEPMLPRIAKRQQNRNNVQTTDTPEEYYRIVLAIPMLDTFISEMKLRFNKISITASKLMYLVPSIIVLQKDPPEKLRDKTEVQLK